MFKFYPFFTLKHIVHKPYSRVYVFYGKKYGYTGSHYVVASRTLGIGAEGSRQWFLSASRDDGVRLIRWRREYIRSALIINYAPITNRFFF